MGYQENKGRVDDGASFQIWVLRAGLGSDGRLMALNMLGLKPCHVSPGRAPDDSSVGESMRALGPC